MVAAVGDDDATGRVGGDSPGRPEPCDTPAAIQVPRLLPLAPGNGRYEQRSRRPATPPPPWPTHAPRRQRLDDGDDVVAIHFAALHGDAADGVVAGVGHEQRTIGTQRKTHGGIEGRRLARTPAVPSEPRARQDFHDLVRRHGPAPDRGGRALIASVRGSRGLTGAVVLVVRAAPHAGGGGDPGAGGRLDAVLRRVLSPVAREVKGRGTRGGGGARGDGRGRLSSEALVVGQRRARQRSADHLDPVVARVAHEDAHHAAITGVEDGTHAARVQPLGAGPEEARLLGLRRSAIRAGGGGGPDPQDAVVARVEEDERAVGEGENGLGAVEVLAAAWGVERGVG